MRRFTCTLACGLLVLSGCETREKQLQRVAKDWCQTIRACQVIPVYPLTEDLQPGDVFLVQLTVDDQQKIYRDSGFLPLDNHLGRIDPGSAYDLFYDHSFIPPESGLSLPMDWLRPGGLIDDSWQSAPAAAFPTYSFSVSQDAGINLAVPISGVPVGLSLLGARSANGTVSLKEARTLGVDTQTLYEQLLKWTDAPGRAEFIATFGPRPGNRPRNYLRVITRVYLVGAVDVRLNNTRSSGGGLDVGAAQPVEARLPNARALLQTVADEAQQTYLGVAMPVIAAPTHRAGSDVGLSSAEVAAREAARKEARDAEITKRREELAAAKDELADAERAAAESNQFQAWRAAQIERDAAAAAVHEGSGILEALENRRPPASNSEIDAARSELAAAKQVLTSKEQLLDAAQASYQPLVNVVAAHQGEVDVAQVALDRLQGMIPGGSFRFTAASARSISLTERFSSPLVVGYLAFDVEIGPYGELGRPIPTHALIERDVRQSGYRPGQTTFEPLALQAIYGVVKRAAETDPEAESLQKSVDRMTRFIPGTFVYIDHNPDQRDQFEAVCKDVPRTGFDDYVCFRLARHDATGAIERIRNGSVLMIPNDAGNMHRASPEEVDIIAGAIATHAESPAERRASAYARRNLFDYMARNALNPALGD